eukprot:5190945-Amphidinium_carterae.3
MLGEVICKCACTCGALKKTKLKASAPEEHVFHIYSLGVSNKIGSKGAVDKPRSKEPAKYWIKCLALNRASR